MSDPTSVHLPVASSAMVAIEKSALYPEDRHALEKAVRALEHTNLAARLATLVGRQLGSLTRLIPGGVSTLINKAAEQAIAKALQVAVGSLRRQKTPMRNTRVFHKAIAAASGAAGGLFGLSTLPIELPLSTIIILRAIADIARMEGEDLDDPETGLACLEVFALGAHEDGDNFTDSGYFATRGILAKTVSEASRFVLERGVTDQSAPILVRLVNELGSRFGLVVSEKLAAQTIPLLGAAGGAAVNYAFVEYFQAIAFGHFTVRRLERTYGSAVVQAEYRKVLEAEKHPGQA